MHLTRLLTECQQSFVKAVLYYSYSSSRALLCASDWLFLSWNLWTENLSLVCLLSATLDSFLYMGLQLVFLQTCGWQFDWQVKLGMRNSGFCGSIDSAVKLFWVLLSTVLCRVKDYVAPEAGLQGQFTELTTTYTYVEIRTSRAYGLMS